MTSNIGKSVILVAVAALGLLTLAYLAYSRPGYFTSQTYLGELLLVEFLAAAVFMYRRVFFPLVLVSFLFAGVDLPVGTFWNVARWVFLGVGAFAGCVIVLKERCYRFGLFHVLAAFAVLATLVSASVSQYKSVAFLKALSFFLLFLYGATGARLAVTGREDRFFRGLLTGSEIFVGAIAAFHLIGVEAMGNPNSLGAVMGVAAPILLWGSLVSEGRIAHQRRLALYAIAMYLAFYSHARAGLGAALISSAVLCLALRKFKLLGQGLAIILVLIAASAILQPEAFSNSVSSLWADVIYKGDNQRGLLASRQSPWEEATNNIRAHPWFGTGLGTIQSPTETGARMGIFSSTTDVTTENGSSYLSLASGVGVLGMTPFVLLLFVLVGRIWRTLAFAATTGNGSQPAVVLAIVMITGLFHAAFEDWMFAPGYYICVLFWSLAFIFVDQSPAAAVSRAVAPWSIGPVRNLGRVAPSP